MRLYLIAGLFFLSASGLAQSITISGHARDRTTHEPLPFASVTILGKSIGTITNLNGEFDFHLPAGYRNEILVISMLGYANFEAPVWSVMSGTGQPQVFELEKSPTLLDEIVVADTLSGSDIMRIALSRIDENYPMQPFLLNGFYRDAKKVGGTYISLLEARSEERRVGKECISRRWSECEKRGVTDVDEVELSELAAGADVNWCDMIFFFFKQKTAYEIFT